MENSLIKEEIKEKMDVDEAVDIQLQPSEVDLEREQRLLDEAEEAAVYKENVNRDMQNRLEYLLKQTEIFNHFTTNTDDPQLENSRNPSNSKASKKPIHRFTATPDFITNGQMRDYQVEGLNWMISLFENGISGILADEMGLGKTLQTISFLGYLKHTKKLSRHLKFLVMVPKTTMKNWMNEFAHWCPTIRVVDLQGDKETRKVRIQNEILPKKWDVLLTSYEMSYIETSLLKKFKYSTVILDEGHRIKNENTLTARKLRELECNHRMILTGTPIHNSVHELWALMNFLLPDFFNSGEDFDNWFKDMDCINDDQVIGRLKAIIRPFVLRRIKADVEKSIKPKRELKVYVGMTDLQRKWYQKVLLKEVTTMDPQGYITKVRLDFLLMHLRKVTNHPYLFEGAEEGPPFFPGEHLITSSGKMVVMDKLLTRLKAEGSRVLIFSQFTRMLDIIEDYCNYRKYTYCRLDGSYSSDKRTDELEKFTNPDSDKFIFLLSTRSGGLGINLAVADTVIIYDSDFNPQMDLQAMDRAHRIGQTKEVRVFKLVLENSVDDRIVEAAEMKFTLDQKLIKGAPRETRGNIVRGILAKELDKGLDAKRTLMADEDLDTILHRSEKRQKKELAEQSDVLVLQHKYESLYKFDGEDFKEKAVKISRKMRDTAPDVPRWYRAARIKSNYKYNPDHLPYYVQHYEPHWFFSPKLRDYIERDRLYFMQMIGHQQVGDEEMRVKIERVMPLTVLEREDCNTLLRESFKDWTSECFTAFIEASGKYGKNNIDKIAISIRGKAIDEVRCYWETFWQRYKELPDYERYIRRIEFGETLLAQREKIKLENPDDYDGIKMESMESMDFSMVPPLTSYQAAQIYPLGPSSSNAAFLPNGQVLLAAGQKRKQDDDSSGASTPKKFKTMNGFSPNFKRENDENSPPYLVSPHRKPLLSMSSYSHGSSDDSAFSS